MNESEHLLPKRSSKERLDLTKAVFRHEPRKQISGKFGTDIFRSTCLPFTCKRRSRSLSESDVFTTGGTFPAHFRRARPPAYGTYTPAANLPQIILLYSHMVTLRLFSRNFTRWPAGKVLEEHLRTFTYSPSWKQLTIHQMARSATSECRSVVAVYTNIKATSS